MNGVPVDERTPEQSAFVAIFGDGKKVPCDEVLASKVLVEYWRSYEGQQEKRTGKKRGDAKLTSYVHQQGED